MEISELKYRLLQDLEGVLQYLLPGGKRNGNEYNAGSISGEEGRSLRVHLRGDKKGVWQDFASGTEGGDIIELWKSCHGVDLAKAIIEIHEYLGLPREERKKKAYFKPEHPPYEELKDVVLRYLTDARKISKDTLDLFCITSKGRDVIYPSYKDDELIHWKKISIDRTPKGDKKVSSSTGTQHCLFGWQASEMAGRSIVICEGELDAMSLHDYGYVALSVPYGGGAGDKQKWVDFEKESLARFDTIYLALDDDFEGYVATQEIASRLGVHRCKVVKLPRKDANACLQEGVPKEAIRHAFENATSLSVEQLRGLAPSASDPPHSTALEQFILSWLLNNTTECSRIFNLLDDTDFFWGSNRVIYRAARVLFNNGLDCGLVNIVTQLTKTGDYGDVISRGHLDELKLIIPNLDVDEVCATIRGFATRRNLMIAGREITRISSLEKDATIASSMAHQAILSVTNREVSKANIKSLSEAMEPVMLDIEYNMAHPNEFRGIRSGMDKLDRQLGGFRPGQFIVTAGRPGMGKTAQLLVMIYNCIVRASRPCVLFSLEMSDKELFYRMIAMHTGITTEQMRAGTLTKHDYERVTEFYVNIASKPLYVDDRAGLSPNRLQLVCEQTKLKYGDLGLVCVDYIGLMEPDNINPNANTVDRVASITKGLKGLAKTMQVPLVAAAQLSRSVEMRQNKRPILSDLRDSGTIEQDADVVMFLYRDEYYNKDSEDKGLLEIDVAKHREGPTGMSKYIWDPARGRITNIQERQEEPPL